MIYTVTLNPSLDYTMNIKRLQTGSVNRASGATLIPGGKGINVSTVLASLGVSSVILGYVAGFTGSEIERALKEKELDTDFIHLDSGLSRINVKLPGISTTDINAPGPDVSPEAFKLLLDKLSQLKDGDTIVIAGALPPTLDDNTYSAILRAISDRNITTIVDSSGAQLEHALAFKPYLIKPNRYELSELVGFDCTTLQQVQEGASYLQDLGARNVLVSLDNDGALLLEEDGTCTALPAPQGKVVNSIGAGDSMLAGVIYGLTQSGSLIEALKYGIAAGSACAFSPVLPTAAEIRALKR